MDRLTKGRLNKELELELKLAMLQINYESEIIANKLEYERRIRFRWNEDRGAWVQYDHR
nr:MAG TPA: hypothetical protein [Caudoviricetes sp.]